MARYIDIDGYKKLFDNECKETKKLIEQGETHLDNLAEGFYEASQVIDRIPTTDAIQVVRCKDCAVPHNQWTGCPKLNGLVTPPDFYCSYGERKLKK